ncbi:MAG: carboxymuconolactone decarboxylase family protein [Candidatus Riflebacteria bacterium]|nr:carboxymuconolactone decarboxylase family protein [Candidatus Riflebacteria bacterium]
MTRPEIYREMEEIFGLVPSFFKTCSDATLGLEWRLFKKIEIDTVALPNKTKELIGVALAASLRCRYCSYFHTKMAKLNGANDEEIEEAVHLAKASAGWSSYVNGLQIDFENFKSEVDRACEHVSKLMSK